MREKWLVVFWALLLAVESYLQRPLWPRFGVITCCSVPSASSPWLTEYHSHIKMPHETPCIYPVRHFLCIYSQTKGKVFVLIENQHAYMSYLHLHTTTKNWIYLHIYHKSRDWHCLRRYGVWTQVWITCHHCLEREIKAVKSMVNEMIFKDTRYNCLPSAYYFVYVRWKCPNGHYVVQSMRLVHLYKDHIS